MTPRGANSRHAIDSCTFQLHAWQPFQVQTLASAADPSKHPFPAKKPCRSDRSTTPASASGPPAALDLSRLTLLDDPPPTRREEGFRWFPRKRRRRGSLSVSGRSSDRSGTRPRGGVSAAYATCSDFPLAAGGTDSSGELFVIGDGSWGSDVSEAARVTKREVTSGGGGGSERESSGTIGFQGVGNATLVESQCNESGYGSEPGYRGDGELGYDDELEEDEDDCRHLFWGEEIGDTDQMDIVGENNFAEQKAHHRGRRKKHDWRINPSLL
ncbi:uncharacterized protein LOC121969935 [Zingiber officinale]|uniref:Uncharacterized protein n=1 Tax=Zingiber officinale TaxID=94328 RepID=A0A8J5H0G1_ZINOF|nr:uncharacterized protein LOC121969935 [Zingiber officinale]KAG6514101.1 hypothetical protein ZIOFF_024441 [Zingiber officinale]